MSDMQIDTSRINNERVAVYIAEADRRVVIGVRFALEALGIELPEFLRRGRPGPRRNRVNTMMAALDADSRTTRPYREEKLKIRAFTPLR